LSEFDPNANLSIGGFTYVPMEKYMRLVDALKVIADNRYDFKVKSMRLHAETTLRRELDGDDV